MQVNLFENAVAHQTWHAIDIKSNKARYNWINAKYRRITFWSVPTNPNLEFLVKRNWCKFREFWLHSVVILPNGFDILWLWLGRLYPGYDYFDEWGKIVFLHIMLEILWFIRFYLKVLKVIFAIILNFSKVLVSWKKSSVPVGLESMSGKLRVSIYSSMSH